MGVYDKKTAQNQNSNTSDSVSKSDHLLDNRQGVHQQKKYAKGGTIQRKGSGAVVQLGTSQSSMKGGSSSSGVTGSPPPSSAEVLKQMQARIAQLEEEKRAAEARERQIQALLEAQQKKAAAEAQQSHLAQQVGLAGTVVGATSTAVGAVNSVKTASAMERLRGFGHPKPSAGSVSIARGSTAGIALGSAVQAGSDIVAGNPGKAAASAGQGVGGLMMASPNPRLKLVGAGVLAASTIARDVLGTKGTAENLSKGDE